VALSLVLLAPMGASAQGNPDPLSFKFNSGQSVQPYFEGWSKDTDGSFLLWFGYMNRNYVQVPVVAVGEGNKFEPAPADRGQPTVFAPRTNRMLFNVKVPADFGKKELTWSITANGKTEKAVGWLEPEWEIDPIYAGKFQTEAMKKNKAPEFTITAANTVKLPATLTLSADVKDDGLPVIKPPTQAVGQETPPTLKPAPDQAEIPVNVPSVAGGGGRGGRGLALQWVLWRGPAPVKFDAARATVKEGKAQSVATFSAPGTYLFHVIANDGELKTQKEFTVTVN